MGVLHASQIFVCQVVCCVCVCVCVCVFFVVVHDSGSHVVIHHDPLDLFMTPQALSDLKKNAEERKRSMG